MSFEAQRSIAKTTKLMICRSIVCINYFVLTGAGVEGTRAAASGLSPIPHGKLGCLYTVLQTGQNS